MAKSKMSKACDISQSTKSKVWERDGGRCIICGNPNAAPNAHYIRRSQGGLGVEQNVVTLCLNCHNRYDNGDKREEYGKEIERYLRSHYHDWNPDDLIYRKWKL